MTDAETWVRGDWMQTHTGRRFYPMSPRPDEIDVTDIAHALSMLCRYGGHVDRFYSVAEHCVLMSEAIEPEHGRGAALYALLHDATEAYVVDVPRPLKRYLSDYKAIEDAVWAAIVIRFGLPAIAMPASVHEADNRILANERAALLSRAEPWPMLADLEPLPVAITGWLPAEGEARYLARLMDLTREAAA